MPMYEVALVISVEADSYPAALRYAVELADGIGDTEEILCYAEISYEHDNDGQRVLYLDAVGE